MLTATATFKDPPPANSPRMHSRMLQLTLPICFKFLIQNHSIWTSPFITLQMGGHNHKCLKLIKLCLGPILTCLQTSAGFLIDTKIKADTKLTVVIRCQIFARKSVVPEIAATVGLGTRSGILRKKYFSNYIFRQLKLRLTDFGLRLTKEIFNILPHMWRGRQGRGDPATKK